MSPLILFAIIAGVPFLLVMLLRVHASAFFISIGSGFLLTQFIGDTAGLLTGSLVKSSPDTTLLLIFVAPILLTLWFMRKSLPSSQLVLQFLPQLGSSLLVFVLLIPLLSSDTQATLSSDTLVSNFVKGSDAIVIAAVVLQMLLMIITARPPSPKKGKR